MSGVRVTVRLSGRLAERLGPRRAMELADGATVGDLLAALAREAALETGAAATLAVADGTILPRAHALADGDELGVLVPVAGG